MDSDAVNWLKRKYKLIDSCFNVTLIDATLYQYYRNSLSSNINHIDKLHDTVWWLTILWHTAYFIATKWETKRMFISNNIYEF